MKKNIFNFFLIWMALLAVACSKKTISGSQLPTSPATDVKKYLALGDSYTIGQSVNAQERFPVQAKNMLAERGFHLANPQIVAQTGWTTANLQQALSSPDIRGPYDVVTLLIGVNDQYQGKDTAGYRDRFTQLLQWSVSLAGQKPQHVIVLSIPDYSVTPFAQNRDTARIRKEINFFNAINKEVAAIYKTQYLDITPSTREASNNPALLAGDGLHPSGEAYKQWAERLVPLMKPLL